jgi:rhodanese-related sulfurtransferase
VLLKEVRKMKLIRLSLAVFLPFFAAIAFSPAVADIVIPIKAESAFDAVQRQVIPETNLGASVVLVDVRDPLEVFSSGAAAAVTNIVNDSGNEYVPDDGVTRLVNNSAGYGIEYTENAVAMTMPVANVSQLVTEPIAINIPVWRLTENGWKRNAKNFYPAVEKLASEFDVIILYCRTGGRSGIAGAGIEPGLFYAVYEIDDPNGKNGQGGFSGPNYSKSTNAYNGYAGFPGRLNEPISWVDSGLPVDRASKTLQ